MTRTVREALDWEPERLSDEEVQIIYAAYDSVACYEAQSVEGRRRIVEPIYLAVIAARIHRATRVTVKEASRG